MISMDYLPGNAKVKCGDDDAHTGHFQCKQMQGIVGNIAPFDLQIDIPAVPARLFHGIHRSTRFSEGFYDGKAPRVFQHCPGQIPVGGCENRCIFRAVLRDDQQKDQRRQGDRRLHIFDFFHHNALDLTDAVAFHIA